MVKPQNHDRLVIIDPSGKTCHLTICKNASTSLRTVLKKQNHNIVEIGNGIIPDTVETIVLLLRNPIERFVSGMAEAMKLRADDPNRNIISTHPSYTAYKSNNMEKATDLFLELVKNHPRINIHILPQYEKIELVTKKEAFDMIKDPRIKIHLMEGGNIHPQMLKRTRKNATGVTYSPTAQQTELINKLYEKDMELFNQAKKMIY